MDRETVNGKEEDKYMANNQVTSRAHLDWTGGLVMAQYRHDTRYEWAHHTSSNDPSLDW